MNGAAYTYSSVAITINGAALAATEALRSFNAVAEAAVTISRREWKQIRRELDRNRPRSWLVPMGRLAGRRATALDVPTRDRWERWFRSIVTVTPVTCLRCHRPALTRSVTWTTSDPSTTQRRVSVSLVAT